MYCSILQYDVICYHITWRGAIFFRSSFFASSTRTIADSAIFWASGFFSESFVTCYRCVIVCLLWLKLLLVCSVFICCGILGVLEAEGQVQRHLDHPGLLLMLRSCFKSVAVRYMHVYCLSMLLYICFILI